MHDTELLIQKYPDISSSYIVSGFNNLEIWEMVSGRLPEVCIGRCFLDRMFYNFDWENYDFDVDGVLFAVEQSENLMGILKDENSSTQNKMEAIYRSVYLNDELTQFEKLELLYFSQGYFILTGDGTDLFLEYSVSGKTMEEWIESLLVHSLEELAEVEAESDRIIAEARANYAPYLGE